MIQPDSDVVDASALPKPRICLTAEQSVLLKAAFTRKESPCGKDVDELSTQTGLYAPQLPPPLTSTNRIECLKHQQVDQGVVF